MSSSPYRKVRPCGLLCCRWHVRAHKNRLAYFLQVSTPGKQVVVVCNQGGSLDTKSGAKFGFPSRCAAGVTKPKEPVGVRSEAQQSGGRRGMQIAQGSVLPQGGGLQASHSCGGRRISARQAMGRISIEPWGVDVRLPLHEYSMAMRSPTLHSRLTSSSSPLRQSASELVRGLAGRPPWRSCRRIYARSRKC